MRICIVGAGAIGGYLGAKLALSGEEVTLIARGKHLEVIQQDGLIIHETDGSVFTAKPSMATSDIQAAGIQDVVVLSVKAHSLPSIAPEIGPLIGPNTTVVTAQNGLPWWYFHKHGGEYEGRCIHSVDPEGKLNESIHAEKLVGGIIFFAAELVAPGIIKHMNGNRIVIGELDGLNSERVQRISQTFAKTSLDATVTTDIRSDIWLKLWGNLAFNPVSALTRATLKELSGFSPTRELIKQVMNECRMVAGKLGIQFGMTEEQRIQQAEKMGNHKTSMLQDIEAGRPTEVETLVGAVCELARLTKVQTPHLDTLYACVKMLDHSNRATGGR